MRIQTRRIGIDIGKVIVGRDTDEYEAGKSQTEIPGARETIAKLVADFGYKNVFLVSKAGALKQIETRIWLAENNFYRDTEINPHNVIFCLHRADKAKICKSLNLTHFIDDRLEVLSHMIDVVPHLYLFNPQPEEMSKFSEYIKYVYVVKNWIEVKERLLDP